MEGIGRRTKFSESLPNCLNFNHGVYEAFGKKRKSDTNECLKYECRRRNSHNFTREQTSNTIHAKKSRKSTFKQLLKSNINVKISTYVFYRQTLLQRTKSEKKQKTESVKEF